MSIQNQSENSTKRFTTRSGVAPHVARKFAMYEFGKLFFKLERNESERRYDVFVLDKKDVGGKYIELDKNSVDKFKSFFEKGTMYVIVIPIQSVELYSRD